MNTDRITKWLGIIWNNWAPILALLVAVIAASLAIKYSGQPLLEQHGFRQTQTASTSFWMIKDGWKLAYETPVGGYPWTIPMEFPIYQSLVALIVCLFHLPLDATGRLLSFCFLLACAWPAFAIVRRLQLNAQVAWVFCALLWSSPIYLFWGRTFMMETAALFFTLAAIPFAIDLLKPLPSWRSTALFSIFATLGMLQKSTTATPVLIVLAIVTLINHLKQSGFSLPAGKKSARVAIAYLFPFIITVIWTAYADHIKSQSSFSFVLTSKSLSGWNFGTLDQRLDYDEMKAIFWGRVISDNAAGFAGIALLSISLFLAKPRIRRMLVISLVLFVLPVFIFTNLHIVHNYYQTACTVFLVSALALAMVCALPARMGKLPLTPFLVLAMVCSNLYFFNAGYGNDMRGIFSVSQSRTLAIADVIKRYTPGESGIVVFGADWSSEIGYYSERKSFTVPLWYYQYDSVWQSPAASMGDLKLGAIVFIINDRRITETSIREQPDVKSDSSHLFRLDPSCYIWIPGVKSISLPERQG